VGISTIPQTRSVLIPFVRPEIVIISFDVLPIRIHIAQKGGLSSGFQDTSDIVLLAGVVAVRIKFAIAAAQRCQSVKGTNVRKNKRRTGRARARVWSMSRKVQCWGLYPRTVGFIGIPVMLRSQH